MLPDLWPIRVTLKILILAFDLIGPLALLYTLLGLFVTSPAPPPILLFDLQTIEEHATLITCIEVLALSEAAWRVVHQAGRGIIARGWWDLRPGGGAAIQTEERWRLWKGMLESDRDPSEWLLGMFLKPGFRHAKEGMRDEAVRGFKLSEVGRTNIEEYIAHYLFSLPLKRLRRNSLDRAELHAMVSLLELVMTESTSHAQNVTMQLKGPSTILTPPDVVAATRSMLSRHGFGLTNGDSEGGDDEEWRKSKAILSLLTFPLYYVKLTPN
ncbi:hypothetical protein RQP46_005539 [Phenoliferia psychrophenolica]